MKFVSALVTLVYFSSCDQRFSASEVIGVYVPKGYRNNFDTIELKSDGTYYRRIYDKNQKPILEKNGKWELIDNKLRLPSFNLNFDDDLLASPTALDSSEYDITTYFHSENHNTEFCVGHHEKAGCYIKVD